MLKQHNQSVTTNTEIGTWKKVVQNKTTKRCHLGLAIWSQVMNKLVIGNWKVALVECVAPQNNLLRDKAEFIAYCHEEDHHRDQAPQEGS